MLLGPKDNFFLKIHIHLCEVQGANDVIKQRVPPVTLQAIAKGWTVKVVLLNKVGENRKLKQVHN